MEFKIIEYGTPDYEQMVDLRDRILRQPIKSVATEEELAEDEKHILLGAFFMNSGQIVGCCFLSQINRQVVRLRQMAIDTYYQKRGLGGELLAYAERIARMNAYQELQLHARETAIGFYQKNEYTVISDIFTEVGIPHVEMTKSL